MTLIRFTLSVAMCLIMPQVFGQSMEKMLRFRIGDSVWMYQRALARPRLFIGERMVNQRELMQHLAKGDIEVGEIMQEANKYRRRANYIGLAGGVTFAVSYVWAGGFSYNNTANRSYALPITLLATSFAAEIVSTIYLAKAGNRYNQSIRLFNYKANKGTLEQVTLHMGPGDYGVGLQVMW